MLCSGAAACVSPSPCPAVGSPLWCTRPEASQHRSPRWWRPPHRAEGRRSPLHGLQWLPLPDRYETEGKRWRQRKGSINLYISEQSIYHIRNNIMYCITFTCTNIRYIYPAFLWTHFKWHLKLPFSFKMNLYQKRYRIPLWLIWLKIKFNEVWNPGVQISHAWLNL